ncbi:class 3 adenylate cyclase [Deinococcus sp. HSC-46F16]|uniref:adenylate/guanylate cyclase domain-containing protein n=1 Tax=Deinococcus sp. HSC-46F16 TaxID=2910968 RepID=UPI0020A219CF|nr:adenylate/guanylate cyclase domain-containing protein [Deinococcus sp. HSC-46F16]MCP2015911.1 class 3 adenylate cyclase [Deinococcus sp. HSC-46F16]
MARTVREALRAVARDNLQDLSRGRTIAKSVQPGGSSGIRSYAEPTITLLREAGLLSAVRTLGGHPGFDPRPDETREAPVTTMFADLRNFTKYALFLPLDQVREIKARVIKTAVDTVHAFDGHVHNIPGDGVMAFFGAPGEDPRLGATRALRAGAYLLTLIRDDVSTFLMEQGIFDAPVKMRVGIEYGTALWGQYGVLGTSEVKATGFPVDFAAKVQQSVGADELGLGEGIVDLLSIPDDFILRRGAEYRRQYKNEVRVKKSYVFDWVSFIDSEDEATLENMGSAYPGWEPRGEYTNPRANELLPIAAHSIRLVTHVAAREGGPWKLKYNSLRKLPKGWHLRFKVEHTVPPPFEVEWEVVNNGGEAYGAGQTYWRRNHGQAVNMESTRYRGTHLMVCTIKKNGVPVARALRRVLIG